jgi:hypothetical protein
MSAQVDLKGMEIAMQDDGVLLYRGNYDAEKCFKQIVDAGVTWLRINVISSWVGRSGYDALDRTVNEARALGIHVQLTIMGRPRWDADAKRDAYGVPHIDPDPAAYAHYCTEVVNHFKDRVHRYSIWNEPNYPAFLGSDKGRNTADLYHDLYKAGSAAVRAAQPKAQILWGEIAGGQGALAWTKRALGNGGVHADGFAVHPYQYQIAPTQKKAGDFLQFGHLSDLKHFLGTTSLIRTADNKPCGIYITEFGWFAEDRPRSIPEATRAQWCPQTIKIAADLGVKQYLYYTPTHSPPSASWDTGLIKTDGTPDPTYVAFKKAVTGK